MEQEKNVLEFIHFFKFMLTPQVCRQKNMALSMYTDIGEKEKMKQNCSLKKWLISNAVPCVYKIQQKSIYNNCYINR